VSTGGRATRRLVVDPRHPDAAAIAAAAEVLRAGYLVAFPTETVYGLGADALSPDAVARVFAAKERPATDPLIVHLASAADLRRVAASVPAVAGAFADRFWPGPLTLILPRRSDVPPIVAAGLATVAVRVPAHPVAHALIAAAGRPIAAPSANRFSRPSPTTAAHVLADLDGRIDLVLDAGPSDIGVESTIVDCTGETPVVRRAGGVTIDALAAIAPSVAIQDGTAADPARPQAAPGQLLRHYAPRAPLTVYDGHVNDVVTRLAREIRTQVAGGDRVGLLAPDDVLVALAPSLAAGGARGRVVVESLGARAAAAHAARVLYAALRRLDDAQVDRIVAAAPERVGLGAAVWDRLRRAAEGRVVRCDAADGRS
jgi:L-threonylcarbamoyladenylate synthase